MRLHRAHGADQFDRTRAIADAPAGHGIGLADAVHGQGAILQARLDLRRGDEFEIVKDQMLIDVVGQHPDMRMAQQHIGQAAHMRLAVAGPGRVRGRVQDHPSGLRGDRGLKLLGGDAIAVRHRALDDDGGAPCQQHHVGIADPIGRRDDHLVAGIERGHEGVVKDLLAAGADGDLGRRVVEAVFTGELAADRPFQFRDAVDGRVAGMAGIDRGLAGFADMGGRVEIGLAGRKADDILALGGQLAGAIGHGDGGRGFDAGERLGQKAHQIHPAGAGFS